MENPLQKLNHFLEKVCEFANLNDQEKNQFINQTNEGLALYILADGEKLVSEEIKNKLRNIMSDDPDLSDLKTALSAYIKEMIENGGVDIILKRIDELVKQVVELLDDKLTNEQKQALVKITENN